MKKKERRGEKLFIQAHFYSSVWPQLVSTFYQFLQCMLYGIFYLVFYTVRTEMHANATDLKKAHF